MVKKPKKKPKYNINSACRSAWRRVFSRSPIVREVLMAGRREIPKYRKDGSLAAKPSVQYLCNVCKKWTQSTKVSVDHIEPVIPIDGTFTDWNTFHERLWCMPSNLQILCETCHAVKTKEERDRRKQILDALKQTV